MATDVPVVPPNFKNFTLIFFDITGKSVWSEKCSFKPDINYVKQILPYVIVRLIRKGKKDVKEFSIGVAESNVTMLGRVKDFLGVK